MTKVISLLLKKSGLREADIRRIVEDAPNRYKVFYIEKRSGGLRQIAQPTPDVKFLQRIIVSNYLADLPVHNAAKGYRSGLSIRDNAAPHAQSGPILKLDFRDFFPSIRLRDWQRYCLETRSLMETDDIHLSGRLLFFRPKSERILRLSIGAPSSPMLSNVIMYGFDKAVSEMVAKDHVIYTRYADDLTFSAPRTGHLVKVEKQVVSILRRLAFPVLHLNQKKTTTVTKRYQRSVTGLTLSNDGRVTLGRDRKRLISASVHRAITRDTPRRELAKLSGILAFANGVEPAFIEALRTKYGVEAVDRILRWSPEKKKEVARLAWNGDDGT